MKPIGIPAPNCFYYGVLRLALDITYLLASIQDGVTTKPAIGGSSRVPTRRFYVKLGIQDAFCGWSTRLRLAV